MRASGDLAWACRQGTGNARISSKSRADASRLRIALTRHGFQPCNNQPWSASVRALGHAGPTASAGAGTSRSRGRPALLQLAGKRSGCRQNGQEGSKEEGRAGRRPIAEPSATPYCGRRWQEGAGPAEARPVRGSVTGRDGAAPLPGPYAASEGSVRSRTGSAGASVSQPRFEVPGRA